MKGTTILPYLDVLQHEGGLLDIAGLFLHQCREQDKPSAFYFHENLPQAYKYHRGRQAKTVQLQATRTTA